MQFKQIFSTLIVLFNFWVPCFAQDPSILEHGDAVSCVAFSPVDSFLLASAGGHNTVKLWNLQNNTVKNLKGHTDVVNTVTFSPDGKWLVSGSNDATIKMWDISRMANIETREPVSVRVPFKVYEVTFHPKEQWIATSEPIQLLDIINWTEIATFHMDGWARSVCFSPDGNLLAAGAYGVVQVWDAPQQQVIARLEGHDGAVGSVKFSPDGSLLASAGFDGIINLWDVTTWERFGKFRTYESVLTVDFSPDGKMLASTGLDDVTLYAVESGEKITTLSHMGWINSVVFSPDNTTLASGGENGTVHIWDIDSYLQSLQQPGIVRLIYFLPSDRTLQPDIDAKMDALIKEVQLAYAEIMERHGFGRKTFQYETDANGKAVVHYVVGQFTDAHYRNLSYTWDIWEEIHQKFDTSKNIYFTAIDISNEILDNSNVCGRGSPVGAFGGKLLVPASGGCFNVDVIAHELGHAFGLQHDFRTNPKRVLSTYTADGMIRSFCAAEWLDAHKYFNTGQTFFNEPTTIEMHPSEAVPPNDVRLRFEVADFDGLHQTQLLTPEFEGTGGLIACQRLDGTTATVEFVVPKTIFRHSGKVKLRVIDKQGHFSFSGKRFYPQAGSKIEGPWLWMTIPTGTSGSDAAASGIDYLAEASGGTITEKQIAANGATVGDTVGNKVWTSGKIAPVGDDNITELVNAIGLGEGNMDNHVAYGSIALDSPRLQETRMYVGSDDAIKVWINGVLIHDNPISRAADDYQEEFPVTLKQGTNILLVAVYEGLVYWSGFFGLDIEAEYTVLLPGAMDPPAQMAVDVNGDGIVNIQDLIRAAENYGQTGENSADVNGDGHVDIKDIILVAAAIDNTAGAPSRQLRTPEVPLTKEQVQQWLIQAQRLDLTDVMVQRGIHFFEQLLAALTPKKTVLLPNYPNPFNPETWIPYQLAAVSDVSISIYAADGWRVRKIALGHQPAGLYHHRSRAAYWDGKNNLGEPVASGVYFYTITAGEFSATRKMLILK